ncbi:hypothetical protein AB733_08775 [Photobacterium swingsii]|uniref:Uncharacterized protein n=1 Tax=Photobacterium swingsii TaxID=680026 RepID=A0A0J8VCN0_9GAMM|nr:hypothetical protein [Photobacterium swingsii]KMV31071.1 hypothetical protein AB733_08775 [Photobacterium swingsii]PSW23567.1 hypothetical protein C9I94_15720 [Photobacterium swingsii]
MAFAFEFIYMKLNQWTAFVKDLKQALHVIAAVAFLFSVRFFYELDYPQFILNNTLIPWYGDHYTTNESLLTIGSSFFSYVFFVLIMIKISEWVVQEFDLTATIITVIKSIAYVAIGLSIWFEYNGQAWWIVNLGLLVPVLIIAIRLSIYDA